MRWLDSVKFDHLHPAMLLAAIRVEDIYKSIPAELWITSGNDSQHMLGSKHYEGKALDFRTKTVPEGMKQHVFTLIKSALGPQFFVDLEDLDKPNEHLHIQYNGQ